jgi:regulator of cell morphogenesis and NO signaling
MTGLNSQSTVGEWVADLPRRAQALEKLGIDYCCGGRRSLAEACLSLDIDPDELGRRLIQMGAEATEPETDWRQRSLTALCDHIEQTHHRLLREQLPRLEALAQKVAAAHGERHPSYLSLAQDFPGFRAELEAHMVKEEQVLFPAIRALEGNTAGGAPGLPCSDLSAPLRVMEAEHDSAGEALRRFSALTEGYQPPADACGTLLALLDGLADLERDLHLHIHKENNLLFPRTRARMAPERAACGPQD